MSVVEPNLVFFASEVADYVKDSPMVHIFMKSDSFRFNKYILPSKQISKETTEVTHLTVRNLQLYRDHVKHPSQSLRKVLEALLEYLKKFGRPSILIGHKYCYSDSFRLIRDIKKYSMEKEFATVIAGFTSTYSLFTEKFPEKSYKELTVFELARDVNLPSTNRAGKGNRMENEVFILEKLAKYHFTVEELKVRRSFYGELRRFENQLLLNANPINTTPRVESLVPQNFEQKDENMEKTEAEKKDNKTEVSSQKKESRNQEFLRKSKMFIDNKESLDPRRTEQRNKKKKKAEAEKKDKKTEVISQKKKNRMEKDLQKPKMVIDNKECGKISEVVGLGPKERSYSVPLRTRTRMAMDGDTILY